MMPPRAAVRWSLTGCHDGWGMLGRPTGAPVHVMGITHAEFGPWGLRREFTISFIQNHILGHTVKHASFGFCSQIRFQSFVGIPVKRADVLSKVDQHPLWFPVIDNPLKVISAIHICLFPAGLH